MGGIDVEIINGNCYSSALAVVKLGKAAQWIVPEVSKFSYLIFGTSNVHGHTTSTTIQCNIQMCLLSLEFEMSSIFLHQNLSIFYTIFLQQIFCFFAKTFLH